MALLEENPFTMPEKAAVLSVHRRMRRPRHSSLNVRRATTPAMSSAGQIADECCCGRILFESHSGRISEDSTPAMCGVEVSWKTIPISSIPDSELASHNRTMGGECVSDTSMTRLGKTSGRNIVLKKLSVESRAGVHLSVVLTSSAGSVAKAVLSEIVCPSNDDSLASIVGLTHCPH